MPHPLSVLVCVPTRVFVCAEDGELAAGLKPLLRETSKRLHGEKNQDHLVASRTVGHASYNTCVLFVEHFVTIQVHDGPVPR